MASRSNSMLLFVVVVAILNGASCQNLSIIEIGIPEIVYLLENVTNTSTAMASVLPEMANSLKNQEDLQTTNNLLLKNNTEAEEKRFETVLKGEEERHQQVVALLQRQQATQEQTTHVLGRMEGVLAEMASAQVQIAESIKHLAGALQYVQGTTPPTQTNPTTQPPGTTPPTQTNPTTQPPDTTPPTQTNPITQPPGTTPPTQTNPTTQPPDIVPTTEARTTYNGFKGTDTTGTTGISVTDVSSTDARTTTAAPTCTSDDQFICSESDVCISKEWACDGMEDCISGSDEDEAFCATCPFRFLCTNGLCIDLDNVCDGINHCRDNSDEDQICVEIAAPSVEVVNGKTITLHWDASPPVLEGDIRRTITQYAVRLTPQDGGLPIIVFAPAEANTTLEVTGRLTPETEYGIDIMVVIDTEGRREETYDIGLPTLTIITATACPEFTCYDGTCIFSVWACDGHEDCASGSDEDEALCATCPFQFLCTNGRCVNLEDVCDGADNCRDNSDEDQICVPISPVSVEVVYDNFVTLCIKSSPVLEGDIRRTITQYAATLTPRYGGPPISTIFAPASNTSLDVLGLAPLTEYGVHIMVVIDTEGQGEETYDIGIPTFTLTTAPPCPSGMFSCGDGHCTHNSWACDGECDCRSCTDEDEAFCARCPFQFLCTNGRCTDLTNVCNGKNDCIDNSDECVDDCSFACADGLTCVLEDLHCDYFNDCGDNSDEVDCVCDPITEFQCVSGGCVPAHWRCDDERDCNDGSDEIDCSPTK